MNATWRNVGFDYRGAKVLVTGGTSGLGKGIADAFLAAGAKVTITGTRGSSADYDDDLSAFRFIRYDAEDNVSVDRLAASMSQLDILINNAGIALFTVGFDERDPDIFDRSLRLLLSSVYRLSERCRPTLASSRLAGGGAIINIASMSSFFANHLSPAYGTAKTGLVGLTRQLAVALAKEKIRVNALAVGLARSRMSAGFFTDPSLSGAMLAGVPLGRHGEPIDIAGSALFLCSDAASWITRQTLAVDGGFSISM